MSKSPAVISDRKYDKLSSNERLHIYDHPYAVLYHCPETGQRKEVLYHGKKKGQHDLVERLFNKQYPKLKDRVFGIHWRG